MVDLMPMKFYKNKIKYEMTPDDRRLLQGVDQRDLPSGCIRVMYGSPPRPVVWRIHALRNILAENADPVHVKRNIAE